MSEYNLYGDESCHLLNDNSRYMVLGAIKCPKSSVKGISKDLRNIKVKHSLPPYHEIKSTKVSKGQYAFYEEVIQYFLSCSKLQFRAIIIDKKMLNHKAHNQTHEDFYYKMYYNLIIHWVKHDGDYLIYLDYKDPSSNKRCKYLNEVLDNTLRRFSGSISFHVQQVKSEECELIQLSDLLIGLTCYNAKRLNGNSAKLALIELIKNNLAFDMFSTNYDEKFNVLNWKSKSNV